MDIHLRCRTCACILDEDSPSQSLLLDPLQQHLHWAINNYALTRTEGLPYKVCLPCDEHIKNSMMFQQRCEKAQRHFTSILKKSKTHSRSPNEQINKNICENQVTEHEISAINTQESHIVNKKCLRESSTKCSENIKPVKNVEITNSEELTVSVVKLASLNKKKTDENSKNAAEIVFEKEIIKHDNSVSKYPADLLEYIKGVKLSIKKCATENLSEIALNLAKKKGNSRLLPKFKLVYQLIDEELTKRNQIVSKIKDTSKIVCKNGLEISSLANTTPHKKLPVPMDMDLIHKNRQLNSILHESQKVVPVLQENVAVESSTKFPENINTLDSSIPNIEDQENSTECSPKIPKIDIGNMKVPPVQATSVVNKNPASENLEIGLINNSSAVSCMKIQETIHTLELNSVSIENLTSIHSRIIKPDDPSDYDSDATVRADVFVKEEVDIDEQDVTTPIKGSVTSTPTLSPHLKLLSECEPTLATQVNCATKNNSSLHNIRIQTGLPKSTRKKQKFYCKSCTFITKNKTTLMLHIHDMHIRYYPCNICNKKYKSLKTLKLHIKLEHKESQCKICDKKFKYSAHLRSHLKTHYVGLSTLDCIYSNCNSKFKSRSELRKHINLEHIIKNTFDFLNSSDSQKNQNSEYSKQHKTQNILILSNNKNKEKVTNSSFFKTQKCKINKVYDCQKCESAFSSKVKLRQHDKEIHNIKVKPFSCIHCTKKFQSRNGLKYHIKNIHVELLCKKCNINFKTKFKFDEHCNKNSAKFSCVVEEETPMSLSRIQGYTCNFCKCELESKKALEMHIYKLHLDDYFLFKCDYCGKQIKTSAECKIHLREVHNEFSSSE